MDTQGYERFVLDGAGARLDALASLRMEVAVCPVYGGEMSVTQAMVRMEAAGFVLIDAWPAWHHPRSGEVLQFDLLFRWAEATEPKAGVS